MHTAPSASSRPLVHVALHAYPAIEVDGHAVELPLKAGLALIARLAVEPGRLSRSAAAALLWPDADAALARGRLRRLMHDVNRRLGVDLLAGDADTLWLDAVRHRLHGDAIEARRIAREVEQNAGDVSPEDAAPLLGRDAHQLLEGFAYDADTFAAWLDASRREQLALVSHALERLSAAWLRQGETSAALAAAGRLVRIDPCAEAGYTALMAARGRRGDVAGVAAAYFDGAERLRHELGVRPSATFERVHAEAMAMCVRADERPGAAPPASIRPAPAPTRRAHAPRAQARAERAVAAYA